jgi:hypothetical protein
LLVSTLGANFGSERRAISPPTIRPACSATSALRLASGP